MIGQKFVGIKDGEVVIIHSETYHHDSPGWAYKVIDQGGGRVYLGGWATKTVFHRCFRPLLDAKKKKKVG